MWPFIVRMISFGWVLRGLWCKALCFTQFCVCWPSQIESLIFMMKIGMTLMVSDKSEVAAIGDLGKKPACHLSLWFLQALQESMFDVMSSNNGNDLIFLVKIPLYFSYIYILILKHIPYFCLFDIYVSKLIKINVKICIFSNNHTHMQFKIA